MVEIKLPFVLERKRGFGKSTWRPLPHSQMVLIAAGEYLEIRYSDDIGAVTTTRPVLHKSGAQ